MADKYDKLLSLALVNLKEDEFRYVPEENEIEHTFSEKYLKAIERILNKLDHSYWKYVNTITKKIAVIIITLIVAFSSLMTVDAFRETVINFVITIYQTFSQVEQTSNIESQIKTYYSFNNLPTGYEINISNYSDSMSFQACYNKFGHLTLNQVPSNSPNLFNSEHGELREAIINNTPCLICQDDNYFFCYWEFDGYRFELIYPVDLGEEFMSEVVGNLIEIDPEDMQN